MSAADGFTERMRIARELKGKLIRSLGHEGGARWCEHLAVQIRADAERVKRPLEAFPIRVGSPEASL